MTETVIIQKALYPDSIEIGTPGKGGCMKVHFDAGNLPEAQQRIENMVNARAHFLQELSKKGVHVNGG